MNHEPECVVTHYSKPSVYLVPEYLCDCERIRSAYQRGREDAAKAIRELPTTPETDRFAAGHVFGVMAAYHAARGDGEQE